MRFGGSTWLKFWRDRRGAVSVPTALMMTVFIGLIGASIEMGYAYWQYNAAQHAARMGVRIAATSDPVADSLNSMTGLNNETDPGDPMPAYSINCFGKTKNCSSGNMDVDAFKRIYFGKNMDGVCGATGRDTRGMCDQMSVLSEDNVIVSYKNSGFGTAGNPADVVPLITVTLTDLRFNFLFLDMVTGDTFTTMPDVSVTAMSEDLRTGS